MKTAIVHDYFTQMGGAEKVAEELWHMIPSADLFATVALPDKMPPGLRGVPVTTTWMQHLPGMQKYYRLYFLLYPLAVKSLRLWSYDLIISSSSGYVKGVNSNPNAVHVCYCHTPPRWVWSFDSYSSRETFGNSLKSAFRAMMGSLRKADLGASRQPDHFVANSRVVAERIRHAYGRYAEVIYPPIDVERFPLSLESEDYYIVLARLVPYKRIDLAVSAFTKMGKKLVIIGSGPAAGALKKEAGPSVVFVGRLSDEEVVDYVGRCAALIFPGEEDFGMAPLEVAAAGKPTIAFEAGGAVETVVDGVTGVFFEEQTTESLIEAVGRFERQSWDARTIRNHAHQFSVAVFQAKFAEFLRRVGAPMPAELATTLPHTEKAA